MTQSDKERALVLASRAAVQVRTADEGLISTVRLAYARGATVGEIEQATAMPLEIIEHIVLERADA